MHTHVHEQERGREREKERESQADSLLTAESLMQSSIPQSYPGTPLCLYTEQDLVNLKNVFVLHSQYVVHVNLLFIFLQRPYEDVLIQI